jgi:hypothetical protein
MTPSHLLPISFLIVALFRMVSGCLLTSTRQSAYVPKVQHAYMVIPVPLKMTCLLEDIKPTITRKLFCNDDATPPRFIVHLGKNSSVPDVVETEELAAPVVYNALLFPPWLTSTGTPLWVPAEKARTCAIRETSDSRHGERIEPRAILTKAIL